MSRQGLIPVEEEDGGEMRKMGEERRNETGLSGKNCKVIWLCSCLAASPQSDRLHVTFLLT